MHISMSKPVSLSLEQSQVLFVLLGALRGDCCWCWHIIISLGLSLQKVVESIDLGSSWCASEPSLIGLITQARGAALLLVVVVAARHIFAPQGARRGWTTSSGPHRVEKGTARTASAVCAGVAGLWWRRHGGIDWYDWVWFVLVFWVCVTLGLWDFEFPFTSYRSLMGTGNTNRKTMPGLKLVLVYGNVPVQ